MTRTALILAAAPVNDALYLLIGMFLSAALGVWWAWRALGDKP